MRSVLKTNRFRSKSNRGNPGNPVNRVYDSAGPDGKVRGTPQQIIEKYQLLSRDASTAGDHVAAESHLQHAEHYARILTSARRAAQQRREERFGDMPHPDAQQVDGVSIDSKGAERPMDRDEPQFSDLDAGGQGGGRRPRNRKHMPPPQQNGGASPTARSVEPPEDPVSRPPD